MSHSHLVSRFCPDKVREAGAQVNVARHLHPLTVHGEHHLRLPHGDSTARPTLQIARWRSAALLQDLSEAKGCFAALFFTPLCRPCHLAIGSEWHATQGRAKGRHHIHVRCPRVRCCTAAAIPADSTVWHLLLAIWEARLACWFTTGRRNRRSQHSTRANTMHINSLPDDMLRAVFLNLDVQARCACLFRAATANGNGRCQRCLMLSVADVDHLHARPEVAALKDPAPCSETT